MTQARIITLRTTVFNLIVFKNVTIISTKDASNTKSHIIFLNYWVKKAIQNTVAHTHKQTNK